MNGPKTALRDGLIPAHAGKTLLEVTEKNTIGAHPRSRGENAVEGLIGQVGMGSSPLTRGKHCLLRRDHCRVRLIPAHAGKTSATA